MEGIAALRVDTGRVVESDALEVRGDSEGVGCLEHEASWVLLGWELQPTLLERADVAIRLEDAVGVGSFNGDNGNGTRGQGNAGRTEAIVIEADVDRVRGRWREGRALRSWQSRSQSSEEGEGGNGKVLHFGRDVMFNSLDMEIKEVLYEGDAATITREMSSQW